MILLISSQEKTFNDFTIKVDEKMYISGQIFYDIKYSFNSEFSDKIVRKNAMTDIMVHYLLSDSEDLKKVSGNENYRNNIMMCLNCL